MTGASVDHYFAQNPGSPDRRRYLEFTIAGREYRLAASAGVFSGGRLDLGTSVLLRKAPLPVRPGRYLDLGCGYGAITAVLATHAPGGTVYAVDVNDRALELTRHNVAELGVADRVVVATPEQVPDDVVFDEIWSNPPIRIGKSDLHLLLERWLPRLAVGGTAWLVVARNLGADSLQRWLGDEGWAVDKFASQKGYRVLAVRHHEDDTG